MEHLLTVGSWESDAESWRTWLPVEDRLPEGKEPWQVPESRAATDPVGLSLGDAGGIYVFECRSCPHRPHAYRFDCS